MGGILNTHLSALNHFLDSEYQLLEYDYISNVTVIIYIKKLDLKHI